MTEWTQILFQYGALGAIALAAIYGAFRVYTEMARQLNESAAAARSTLAEQTKLLGEMHDRALRVIERGNDIASAFDKTVNRFADSNDRVHDILATVELRTRDCPAREAAHK